MSAEQEADDLRELIANERLRHMDERSRLGEKVLEERRLRYEVEEEDAVKLADLTALREADQATIASLGLVNKELTDALLPYVQRWEGVEIHELPEDSALYGWYKNSTDSTAYITRQQFADLAAARAALRAAGRLPKGENDA